jgi:hypothetical protein
MSNPHEMQILIYLSHNEYVLFLCTKHSEYIFLLPPLFLYVPAPVPAESNNLTLPGDSTQPRMHFTPVPVTPSGITHILPIAMNYNIVAYLLKPRNAEPEKQPLLVNGSETFGF